MYNLINNNIELILQNLERNHVMNYLWLRAHLNNINDEYTQLYKYFWKIRFINNQLWFDTYFGFIPDILQGNAIELENMLNQLYEIPTNVNNEVRSLHFSFATKLLHITNPDLPIYDSMIADFFYLDQQNNNHQNVQERIVHFVEFYEFLRNEYSRILENNLLLPSIRRFREIYAGVDISNIKIIDSLIWNYVKLLKAGALQAGNIQYF